MNIHEKHCREREENEKNTNHYEDVCGSSGARDSDIFDGFWFMMALLLIGMVLCNYFGVGVAIVATLVVYVIGSMIIFGI